MDLFEKGLQYRSLSFLGWVTFHQSFVDSKTVSAQEHSAQIKDCESISVQPKGKAGQVCGPITRMYGAFKMALLGMMAIIASLNGHEYKQCDVSTCYVEI